VATDAERNRGAGAFSTPGVDVPSAALPYESAAASPLTKFRFQGIDPNAVPYVTADDDLGLRVWSNVAGQSVNIGISFIRAVDGNLTKEIELMTVPVAGTFAAAQVKCVEGFIVGVTAGAVLTTQRGDTWCKVALHRGQAASAQNRICLFQDYVTSSFLSTWPGGNQNYPTVGPGKIRSITGTTPAAGADISETVPALTRWRLISLKAALTTSAAVANRFVRSVLTDGVNTYFNSTYNAAQVASTTINYIFVPGLQAATDVPVTDNFLSIPMDNRIVTGHKMLTLTTAIQAGDQWTAPQYLVEEWIDGL
jgi:hypothetical protein